jgi:hypothetical protein
MSTKIRRDAQIVVRVSTPLRSELESAAMADVDGDLSSTIRRVLIEFAARRITERAAAASKRE